MFFTQKTSLEVTKLNFLGKHNTICLSDFAKCTFFFLVYWVIVAYTWLVKLPKFPRWDEVSWVLFLMSIDCKNEIFSCNQLVCSCVLASVQHNKVNIHNCNNLKHFKRIAMEHHLIDRTLQKCNIQNNIINRIIFMYQDA